MLCEPVTYEMFACHVFAEIQPVDVAKPVPHSVLIER